MEEYDFKYESNGQASEAVGSIIVLVVGVSVAILVNIFTGVLGGKAYAQASEDLLEINETDPTTYTNVITGIQAGFEAQSDTMGYLPMITLGVVIFVILSLVLPMTTMGGYVVRGGGGAL